MSHAADDHRKLPRFSEGAAAEPGPGKPGEAEESPADGRPDSSSSRISLSSQATPGEDGPGPVDPPAWDAPEFQGGEETATDFNPEHFATFLSRCSPEEIARFEGVLVKAEAVVGELLKKDLERLSWLVDDK